MDSAFSLVKSRLALGSPGCLFGFSPPRLKWPNTHPYVKPFSRLGKRNNWSSQSFAWLTLGLVLYWYGIYWHYVYEMNLNTFVSELLFAGWLESGTRSMFGMIRFHGKGGRKKDSVRKEQNGLSSLQQSVYHKLIEVAHRLF